MHCFFLKSKKKEKKKKGVYVLTDDASSSAEHTDITFNSISVVFSPIKGSDQVNTSRKFGSQYG